MKRAIVSLLVLVLLGAAAYVGYRYWDERRFAAAQFGEGTRTVIIPPKTGPHQIAQLLAKAGIVSDAQRFYTHLHYFRRKARLRAGEYEFSGAQFPDEVIGKLDRGEVKLYRFTVPEGLRADEIAPIVASTGLCTADEFFKLARDPAVAKKLGVPGQGLEGFLFPDTYSVPRTVGCAGIAQAMVARYKEAWRKADAKRAPDVKLDELQAVTLASIVEKETGRPEERPRISCVFHNRLKKGMRLGTDPTVIYSVLLENNFHWDGNLHKTDLMRPHPYNTYMVKGLPPGPISNPGAAALEAALDPLQCTDYFFVSRNDRTHVFCPDLTCHEEAVRKWQVEYFHHKRG
ncbi:MAG: endolytic transglycosylase MltG [Myxococcales bacterium]